MKCKISFFLAIIGQWVLCKTGLNQSGTSLEPVCNQSGTSLNQLKRQGIRRGVRLLTTIFTKDNIKWNFNADWSCEHAISVSGSESWLYITEKLYFYTMNSGNQCSNHIHTPNLPPYMYLHIITLLSVCVVTVVLSFCMVEFCEAQLSSLAHRTDNLNKYDVIQWVLLKQTFGISLVGASWT